MPTRSAWVRIIALLLILYLLSQAKAILLPLVLSMILTFMLYPIVRLFSQLRLWPKGRLIPIELAIIISFLFAGVLLTVIIAYIFMPFIGEFNLFIANLPRLLDKLRQILLTLDITTLPDSVRSVIDNGVSNAASYTVNLVKQLVNVTVGVVGQVVELVVVPVLAFYFLKDWAELQTSFINAFPNSVQAKTRHITNEIGTVVSAYIRGQLLVCVLMGVIVFVGMLFFGIDYPLIIGLIAALTEAIPVVGPIIGAIPALILAYLTAPALAFKVLVFYILVHQLENHVLVPNIMKHSLALHPVSIIISLLVGAHLAGISGMIIAVPIAAIIKVLYKHLWHYQER